MKAKWIREKRASQEASYRHNFIGLEFTEIDKLIAESTTIGATPEKNGARMMSPTRRAARYGNFVTRRSWMSYQFACSFEVKDLQSGGLQDISTILSEKVLLKPFT